MSTSDPSLKGQFLVADKRLRDPNFFRSVVLIVEHGDDGAMGLVVNRPSAVSVSRALSEHFTLPEKEDMVYVGGPVEPAAPFLLHTSDDPESNDVPVVPGLVIGSSPDIFQQVVEQITEGAGPLEYRVFSGCAGWSPGQLESELDRGDWHSVPATRDGILPADPYRLWDDLVELVHEAHRMLPPPDSDPRWN